jgi:TusA-related sulfurtransferase
MASWRAGSVCILTAAVVTAGGLAGAPAAMAAAHDDTPPACLTGLVICINQDDHTLRLIDHGAGVLELAVRFGAQRTPTRLGTFKVEWKDENHVSKMFASAMPYSLFFDGGQAVHYSADFAERGYKGASHGCVNTRDLAATKQLFDSVKVGTRVVVYTNDPAKQERIERAAQLEKEQELRDQQAGVSRPDQRDQQGPVTRQDQGDRHDDDPPDSDEGPDGPDDY